MGTETPAILELRRGLYLLLSIVADHTSSQRRFPIHPREGNRQSGEVDPRVR